MPRGDSTRARPTGLLILAGLLLLARVATGIHEAYRPPRAGGLVHWLTPAEVEAMPAGPRKPILYDFSAAWCIPCKQMDGELYSNPAAADFVNDTFVAVRVTDEDRSPAATVLRSRHRVAALPTMVVVHPDTKDPRRLEGYPGRRQALGFLKTAAAGGNGRW
jgi:thiol:disulfide interchange protein